MKKLIGLGIVLISLLYCQCVSAVIAYRFIYPVLADGQKISENIKDPRKYGWYDSGNPFGKYYPGVQGVPCAQQKKWFYHPGEDWNRNDNKEGNEDTVKVYSIADGKIVRIAEDPQYGETILIRHELPQEVDFTSYFLEGTTPPEEFKKTKYCIAQWMHLIVKDGLAEGQEVKLGQELAHTQFNQ